MLILYILAGYLFTGVLFAFLFVTRLIRHVDEGSVGAPWGFRVVIFPGCVIFWPLLLKKYLTALKGRKHD